ncbi:hypothetical protein [Streptomyces sp. NPDC005890]|uniref:hypothetical protein n=1 Tax=Streptomyces sp. NPDC005890 TaxID=3154568 RepID=UPI0033CAC2F9
MPALLWQPVDEGMTRRAGAGMDEVVLDVARAIRPYLPGLVGEDAPRLDLRIVALLDRARDGVDVGEAVLELLGESPATLAWAASVLEDERHLPPDLQHRAVRSGDKSGYSPLANPHGGDPVDAQRYLCPEDGAYAWWRTSVGQEIPGCPDHPGVRLVAS